MLLKHGALCTNHQPLPTSRRFHHRGPLQPGAWRATNGDSPAATNTPAAFPGDVPVRYMQLTYSPVRDPTKHSNDALTQDEQTHACNVSHVLYIATSPYTVSTGAGDGC